MVGVGERADRDVALPANQENLAQDLCLRSHSHQSHIVAPMRVCMCVRVHVLDTYMDVRVCISAYVWGLCIHYTTFSFTGPPV